MSTDIISMKKKLKESLTPEEYKLACKILGWTSSPSLESAALKKLMELDLDGLKTYLNTTPSLAEEKKSKVEPKKEERDLNINFPEEYLSYLKRKLEKDEFLVFLDYAGITDHLNTHEIAKKHHIPSRKVTSRLNKMYEKLLEEELGYEIIAFLLPRQEKKKKYVFRQLLEQAPDQEKIKNNICEKHNKQDIPCAITLEEVEKLNSILTEKECNEFYFYLTYPEKVLDEPSFFEEIIKKIAIAQNGLTLLDQIKFPRIIGPIVKKQYRNGLLTKDERIILKSILTEKEYLFFVNYVTGENPDVAAYNATQKSRMFDKIASDEKGYEIMLKLFKMDRRRRYANVWSDVLEKTRIKKESRMQIEKSSLLKMPILLKEILSPEEVECFAIFCQLKDYELKNFKKTEYFLVLKKMIKKIATKPELETLSITQKLTTRQRSFINRLLQKEHFDILLTEKTIAKLQTILSPQEYTFFYSCLTKEKIDDPEFYVQEESIINKLIANEFGYEFMRKLAAVELNKKRQKRWLRLLDAPKKREKRAVLIEIPTWIKEALTQEELKCYITYLSLTNKDTTAFHKNDKSNMIETILTKILSLPKGEEYLQNEQFSRIKRIRINQLLKKHHLKFTEDEKKVLRSFLTEEELDVLDRYIAKPKNADRESSKITMRIFTKVAKNHEGAKIIQRLAREDKNKQHQKMYINASLLAENEEKEKQAEQVKLLEAESFLKTVLTPEEANCYIKFLSLTKKQVLDFKKTDEMRIIKIATEKILALPNGEELFQDIPFKYLQQKTINRLIGKQLKFSQEEKQMLLTFLTENEIGALEVYLKRSNHVEKLSSRATKRIFIRVAKHKEGKAIIERLQSQDGNKQHQKMYAAVIAGAKKAESIPPKKEVLSPKRNPIPTNKTVTMTTNNDTVKPSNTSLPAATKEQPEKPVVKKEKSKKEALRPKRNSTPTDKLVTATTNNKTVESKKTKLPAATGVQHREPAVKERQKENPKPLTERIKDILTDEEYEIALLRFGLKTHECLSFEEVQEALHYKHRELTFRVMERKIISKILSSDVKVAFYNHITKICEEEHLKHLIMQRAPKELTEKKKRESKPRSQASTRKVPKAEQTSVIKRYFPCEDILLNITDLSNIEIARIKETLKCEAFQTLRSLKELGGLKNVIVLALYFGFVDDTSFDINKISRIMDLYPYEVDAVIKEKGLELKMMIAKEYETQQPDRFGKLIFNIKRRNDENE